MTRPVTDFIVSLEVEYIPIPEDKVGDWCAGFYLLLQLIKEESNGIDWFIRDDHRDHDGRNNTSLFPLEIDSQRE